MFQEAAEPKGGTFLIFLIAGHFDSSLPYLEGSREVCGISITAGRAPGMAAQLGTPPPWAGQQVRCINILRS